MQNHNEILASLIGSRICHDLINPIGALSNGIELLGLSGQTPSPEMALIARSAASANARIRLFRLAFGHSDGASAGETEDAFEILRDSYGDRIDIQWSARPRLPRATAQIVVLSALCLETAMPFGGSITVTQNQTLTLKGQTTRLVRNNRLWNQLRDCDGPEGVNPSEVQFYVLSKLLARRGLAVGLEMAETAISLNIHQPATAEIAI